MTSLLLLECGPASPDQSNLCVWHAETDLSTQTFPPFGKMLLDSMTHTSSWLHYTNL